MTRVLLHPTTDTTAEGKLDDITVHVRDGRVIVLWAPNGWGLNPCGRGDLSPEGVGEVEDTVHRKRWKVTGTDMVLDFEEIKR